MQNINCFNFVYTFRPHFKDQFSAEFREIKRKNIVSDGNNSIQNDNLPVYIMVVSLQPTNTLGPHIFPKSILPKRRFSENFYFETYKLHI